MTLRDESLGPPPTALVVDPEDAVRAVVRSQLEQLGYAALEAPRSAQALRLLDDGYTFLIIVADARMPDMPGWELVREIRRRNPCQAIIRIQGYADPVDPNAEFRGPPVPLLAKPFAPEDLVSVIEEAIATSRHWALYGPPRDAPDSPEAPPLGPSAPQDDLT